MNRRIAIVTGTSRLEGLGKSICVELAKNDIDIFFTYWRNYDKHMAWNSDDNEPELIQKEIEKEGVKCRKMELDLSNSDSYSYLLKKVILEMGEPSILVNNATYSTQTDTDSITVEELDKHYYVNLRATTMLCMEFVKRFTGNKHGRIINISSGQSLSAMSDEIAYAVTKGAIETLTHTISHKIASKGITINAVNPGLTDTGWMNDQQKEMFLKCFPMKRLGQPNDAARLVAFLASKDSEWITGQIIHSEGGFIRERYS